MLTAILICMIMEKVHVNLIDIQFKNGSWCIQPQQSSQVRLCPPLIAVHKLFDVCASLQGHRQKALRRLELLTALCILQKSSLFH